MTTSETGTGFDAGRPTEQWEYRFRPNAETAWTQWKALPAAAQALLGIKSGKRLQEGEAQHEFRLAASVLPTAETAAGESDAGTARHGIAAAGAAVGDVDLFQRLLVAIDKARFTPDGIAYTPLSERPYDIDYATRLAKGALAAIPATPTGVTQPIPAAGGGEAQPIVGRLVRRVRHLKRGTSYTVITREAMLRGERTDLVHLDDCDWMIVDALGDEPRSYCVRRRSSALPDGMELTRRARLQCDFDKLGRYLQDGERMTLYVGDNGVYSVRPTAEFEDGRFVEAAPHAGEAVGRRAGMLRALDAVANGVKHTPQQHSDMLDKAYAWGFEGAKAKALEILRAEADRPTDTHDARGTSADLEWDDRDAMLAADAAEREGAGRDDAGAAVGVSDLPGIWTDPARCSGSPCVDGRRFTIAQLLAEVAEHGTASTIEHYDLPAETVMLALNSVSANFDALYLAARARPTPAAGVVTEAVRAEREACVNTANAVAQNFILQGDAGRYQAIGAGCVGTAIMARSNAFVSEERS